MLTSEPASPAGLPVSLHFGGQRYFELLVSNKDAGVAGIIWVCAENEEEAIACYSVQAPQCIVLSASEIQ